MYGAYWNCFNLETAACSDSVVDLYYSYYECRNLKTAACGENVTRMYRTYFNCRNLKTAVCGNNVTSLVEVYRNCTSLTTAVCGPNVTNMSRAYYDCPNIQGDFYVLNSKITNVNSCFYGRNTSKALNIWANDSIHKDETTSRATFMQEGANLFGTGDVNWTKDTSNPLYYRYYNTQYNVNIYTPPTTGHSGGAN